MRGNERQSPVYVHERSTRTQPGPQTTEREREAQEEAQRRRQSAQAAVHQPQVPDARGRRGQAQRDAAARGADRDRDGLGGADDRARRHDAVAAQVILSAWLERQMTPRNNSHPTEPKTLDES